MPSDTLFPEATKLIGENERAAVESNKGDPQAEGVKAGMAASHDLSEERRQQMSGEQKQQLDMLQEKLKRAQNSVQITPQIALGLVKNTGDKEWLKAIGQDMPAPVLLSMFKYGSNQKMAGKVYKVAHGDKELSVTWEVDKDGELQPKVIGEGEKFSPTARGEDTPKAKADRAARAAAKGGDTTEKDMDKWFKNADKARKEIQDTFTKKGGMPKSGKMHDIVSMFQGGDPENDAKVAALKQNYQDYETAVNNYNDLAEKNGKNPITIDSDVKSAMDKVMSLPGAKGGGAGSSGSGGGDNQAAIDYLKKNYPKLTNPTQQDIDWAKKKMNG